MTEEFKPGDIVTFKSGGRRMTIGKIKDDEASVYADDFFIEAVPLATLRKRPDGNPDGESNG